MDKTTLEQFLSETEGEIDGVRRRIERQAILLERIGAERRDTGDAKELLRHFERLLRTLHADRKLILGLLGRV